MSKDLGPWKKGVQNTGAKQVDAGHTKAIGIRGQPGFLQSKKGTGMFRNRSRVQEHLPVIECGTQRVQRKYSRTGCGELADLEMYGEVMR